MFILLCMPAGKNRFTTGSDQSDLQSKMFELSQKQEVGYSFYFPVSPVIRSEGDRIKELPLVLTIPYFTQNLKNKKKLCLYIQYKEFVQTYTEWLSVKDFHIENQQLL